MRVVGVVGGLAICLASCLEPTEVKLVLTTDMCDLKHVVIKTEQNGEPVATIDPRGVGPKQLGNIVFIPSGKGETFTVYVVGSRQVDGKCSPMLPCVETSRTVSYVTHLSLTLPVVLESACVNVLCGAGKTCLHGRCVDAAAICAAGGKSCDLSDGGPIDTTIDAPSDVKALQ